MKRVFETAECEVVRNSIFRELIEIRKARKPNERLWCGTESKWLQMKLWPLITFEKSYSLSFLQMTVFSTLLLFFLVASSCNIIIEAFGVNIAEVEQPLVQIRHTCTFDCLGMFYSRFRWRQHESNAVEKRNYYHQCTYAVLAAKAPIRLKMFHSQTLFFESYRRTSCLNFHILTALVLWQYARTFSLY